MDHLGFDIFMDQYSFRDYYKYSDNYLKVSKKGRKFIKKEFFTSTNDEIEYSVSDIPGEDEIAQIQYLDYLENLRLINNHEKIDGETYLEIPEFDLHFDYIKSNRFILYFETEEGVKELNFSKSIDNQVKILFNKYHGLILLALIDYFKEMLREAKRDLASYRYIGWKKDDDTSHYEFVTENDTDRVLMLQNSDRQELTQEAVSSFLSLLYSSPEITTIFSYGLLSVFLNGHKRYQDRNNDLSEKLIKEKKDTYNSISEDNINRIVRFSLCICGHNTALTNKKIASAFLDYFKSNLNRPNRVCDHYPHMSISSITERIVKTRFYADCPIIMKPPGNSSSIVSTSSYLRTVHKFIDKKYLKGFPVIISQTRIKRDDILNVDVSTVDTFDYTRVSVIVESLIQEFTDCQAHIYNNDHKPQPDRGMGFDPLYKLNNSYGINEVRDIMVNESFDKFSREFDKDYYNLNLARYCRDLMAALFAFSIYINIEYGSEKALMEQILERELEYLKSVALDVECRDSIEIVSNNESTTDNTKQLLVKILKTIISSDKSALKTTRKGESAILYETFKNAMKEENSLLKIRDFLLECRDSGLIITPSRKQTDGKTVPREYYFKRTIDGNQDKYLILSKSVLDLILS